MVRTAIDIYLEPIYEQAHEDQKMDKFLSELEQAENRMEQLNEKAISIEDIFDDFKTTAK